MRQVILAICCAAALMLGPAHAQYFGSQRPAPPTEPSIPNAEKAAPVKLEPAAPKPVVPKKIVRRPVKFPTGPVAMPSPDVLVMMVRAALAGVNQANFTENYSVLHAMTTPGLQTRVTPAQFGRAFASLRKQNLDLSPALILPPQFTAAPSLTPQGVLRLTGIFPSRPMQISFAIDYVPIDGFWLIDALSISALQAPVAPGVNISTSPTGNRPAETATKSAFWGTRFTRATHFGPRLSFAANPR